MVKNIWLLLVASACLVVGAVVASNTMKKDAIDAKREEILDYLISNNVIERIYQEKSLSRAVALDNLIENIRMSESLDELEELFGKVKRVNLMMAVRGQ